MSPLRTKITEPASNVKTVFARWTLGTSTKSGLSVALKAGDALITGQVLNVSGGWML